MNDRTVDIPAANPVWNRLIFIFSLLGLLIAGYLWKMHADPTDIPCGGSHGCVDVATSIYSEFPTGSGIPVAAFGTVGYLLLTGLAFLRTVLAGGSPLAARRDTAILSLIVAIAGFGLLASLRLTYAELFWIHAICRWCMGSQAIMVLVFGLAVTERLQKTGRRKQEIKGETE